MFNYEEAIQFIHQTNKFGSKLGLENISALLNELGNPHKNLKYIHIAGTNGKGSTASFISHALMAQGYRVGFYISPYLEKFNERIQINNIPISDDDLAKYTSMAAKAIDVLQNQGKEHPTEFEIVTSIGFSYFEKSEVDVVVLEVGLGGRLDSTNIIEKPLAAVITPIGLDHVQYLGDTLDKIAFEKAGIIKKGCQVISTEQAGDVLEVIKSQAMNMQANLSLSHFSKAEILEMDFEKGFTSFRYNDIEYRIRLLGRHQVQNACTAIDTLDVLNTSGQLLISSEAVLKGLNETRWAGRFEIVLQEPKLIIDGAHNLHGIKAFVQAINDYNPSGRRIAIFGMMMDKDVRDVLSHVYSLFDAFYTFVPDNPRSMSHHAIEQTLRDVGFKGLIIPINTIDEIEDKVLKNADSSTTIYSFGSLYYIGEVRQHFLKSKKYDK